MGSEDFFANWVILVPSCNLITHVLGTNFRVVLSFDAELLPHHVERRCWGRVSLVTGERKSRSKLIRSFCISAAKNSPRKDEDFNKSSREGTSSEQTLNTFVTGTSIF